MMLKGNGFTSVSDFFIQIVYVWYQHQNFFACFAEMFNTLNTLKLILK